MKIRRKNKREARVYTSALNDILFILLLFFLIVATLANPNVIKVNNPVASSDNRVKQTVTVSVDKDQNFYVGTTEVSPEMLAEKVGEALNSQDAEDKTVVINADKLATAESVVEVMKAARLNDAKTVFSVANQ